LIGSRIRSTSSKYSPERPIISAGSILAEVWSIKEEIVKSPRVILGIVLALVLAVMTGSVLLLGYVVAGASLLLVVGVLLRKAARRYARSAIPSLHTPWLDVNDREAA
jgi:hypothetical protein